jgi:cobalt/nickel transport protein
MTARARKTWLVPVLLVAALLVLLLVLPVWLAGGAAFGGADDQARHAVSPIAPAYQPWFAPLFEPASAEIASLLFALQAAGGAGVIGYWLGLSVGRARSRAVKDADAD